MSQKSFYLENDTLVKALVLADIGKVTDIIYIDNPSWRQFALEEVDPKEQITKRKFKTAEERLTGIERAQPKTRYTEPTPEMFPGMPCTGCVT